MIHRVLILLLSITYSHAGPLKFESPTPPRYLSLRLNQSSFSYQIGISETSTWLNSAPIVFNAFGKTYSTADGTLKNVGVRRDNDIDRLGSYTSTEWLFSIELNTIVSATFKQYTSQNFVIFKQTFYNDTTGCSVHDASSVISHFPAFQVAVTTPEPLGYFSYGGFMFGFKHTFGTYEPGKVNIVSGTASGPFALLDQTGNAVIISPFSEFMSSSLHYSGTENSIRWGLLGEVDTVPAHFATEYIAFFGPGGINQAYADWGRLMREFYGKTSAYRDSDFTINYLGYYTDNGAYYYYQTENNTNYEQTLVDVQKYGEVQGIPYRYVQLDSWFYPKASDQGVITWIGLPDVFPDGLEGLNQKTKWPVVGHNRFWSHQTTYAKQNGGEYDFIIQPPFAIPTEEKFWDDLFRYSRTWGLAVYEQDWLDTEFDGLNATLTSARLGNNWLLQMGRAAENNGLTIQYCMADPRDALTSLEIPVVTQARASEDYHPGNNNWRLGLTSIFADSLGVAPFKDNFWTTTYQPGNKYNLSEPNPELTAAVATLSTGPVGPGDKIGFSNVELIMRSCDADGLILKPNKPAMAIDAQILELAFKNGIGPAGEVWSTYSMINDNYFHILLAADMTSPYALMPSQIGSLPTYIMENSQIANSAVVPVPFSEDQPLNLTTACTKSNFCLYHTSMRFSLSDRNVIIYGEFSKWVPMSRNRVISFTVGSNDIQLELQGAYMEIVTFLFFEDMNPVYVKCQIGDSGRATMSLVDRACQQV